MPSNISAAIVAHIIAICATVEKHSGYWLVKSTIADACFKCVYIYVAPSTDVIKYL